MAENQNKLKGNGSKKPVVITLLIIGLIFWFLILRIALNQLSRLRIELTGGMPHRCVMLRRGIAVAFLRVQMQQLGTVHVLDLPQDAH